MEKVHEPATRLRRKPHQHGRIRPQRTAIQESRRQTHVVKTGGRQQTEAADQDFGRQKPSRSNFTLVFR